MESNVGDQESGNQEIPVSLTDAPREQLIEEIGRLRAEVATLRQEGNSAAEEDRTRKRQKKTLHDENREDKEIDAEEKERPTKKQRTQHDGKEQQLALCNENERKMDVEHEDQSIDNILALPRELLGRTLDFLEFSERRDFFTCGSRELWERIRVEYETQVMCDLILDRAPRLGFLSHDFTSVSRLNFGRHCSDTALAVLCNERAFPQLTHLAMAWSVHVTDKGLALITENPNLCKKLVLLDITGCNGTTLAGTFLLRKLLINLQVLSRQPAWMDGYLRHTNGVRFFLWADGMFALYGANGEMIECSYVRNLFEEGHHVVSKRQIVLTSAFKNERWQARPEWMRHSWRLGESLLYLPDGQSLLRATPVRGTFPVQGFPRPEDAQLIRVNYRRTLNRQGHVCARDGPNRYATVSHLSLQPLDRLMPPQDVVNRCRHQVERAKVVMEGRQLEADERKVHRKVGGDRNDVPPPFWFQHG